MGSSSGRHDSNFAFKAVELESNPNIAALRLHTAAPYTGCSYLTKNTIAHCSKQQRVPHSFSQSQGPFVTVHAAAGQEDVHTGSCAQCACDGCPCRINLLCFSPVGWPLGSQVQDRPGRLRRAACSSTGRLAAPAEGLQAPARLHKAQPAAAMQAVAGSTGAAGCEAGRMGSRERDPVAPCVDVTGLALHGLLKPDLGQHKNHDCMQHLIVRTISFRFLLQPQHG